MELLIQMVCPACHKSQSLNVFELAPGRRQSCDACQTPARLTPDSLEQFGRDLRAYCES